MPRSIEYVHREIVRVADELEIDPRSREFTRTSFLTHGLNQSPQWDEAGELVSPEELHRPTDVTKHDLETYGGWAKLKYDAASVLGVPPDKDATAARGVELRSTYVRKLERTVATREYLFKKLEESFVRTFRDNSFSLSKKSYARKAKKAKSVLTLLWSDLHFGVDVHDYEVYQSRFNWVVASRRIAALVQAAIDWTDDYDRTELRIVLNGDIMQGVIHLDDSNIRPMTEQIWGAAAILTAAIDQLRRKFPRIKVYCLPGNHDRMTYKGSGRSVSQRWDSHASSLYLCLQQTFRTDDGVLFDIPSTGIGIIPDMDGGVMIAAHGDTEPDPKNVSTKIDTAGLAVKLLKMRESQAIQAPISVAMFGHWHTPTIQMLPSGSFIIVNGSLIGAEPFGQNVIGEFNSQPAQVMFESVPGDPLYRQRVVKLGGVEKDESLSELIPTPKIIDEGKLTI